MKTMFKDISQFRHGMLHIGSNIRTYSGDYNGEQIFPALAPERYICLWAFELIR